MSVKKLEPIELLTTTHGTVIKRVVDPQLSSPIQLPYLGFLSYYTHYLSFVHAGGTPPIQFNIDPSVIGET